MLNPAQLVAQCDLERGTLSGRPRVERRLADLYGCFADRRAYEVALALGNPVVYTVSSSETGDAEGDLHYGLGMVMPGRIGDEYWLTKGHLHAWRPAAECYLGLRGEGGLLLESEDGDSQLLPLQAGTVVYVPGRTAHRTVNTGSSPLLYLGIYPARAGHDYASIAKRNFRCVVVERQGKPAMIERAALAADTGAISR